MSSKTPNLGLTVWDGTDRVSRPEINGNFERLDALKAEDIALSSPQFTEQNVKAALEGLKSSVSSGKNEIARAITDKGVSASGSDTFTQLATKIGQIPSGTNTSDATAVAADILSGKTAYISTGKVTGAMPNRGAGGTVTPGTTDQTKASGYYSSAITIKGDPNLIPANILSGKSIFGVAGSLVPGKPFATGTATSNSQYTINITGLTFRPKYVFGWAKKTMSSSTWKTSFFIITDGSLIVWRSNDGTSEISRDSLTAKADESSDAISSGIVFPIKSDGFSFRVPDVVAGISYEWFAIGA